MNKTIYVSSITVLSTEMSLFSHLPEPIQIILLLLITYLFIWTFCLTSALLFVCVLGVKLLITFFSGNDYTYIYNLYLKAIVFSLHIFLVPLYSTAGVGLTIFYLILATLLNFGLAIWAIGWIVYTNLIKYVFSSRSKSLIHKCSIQTTSSEECYKWKQLLLKKYFS